MILRNMYRFRFIFSGLFVLCLSFGALNSATTQAGFRADFAIYNPGLTPQEDGVWKPEVLALQKMLSAYGWTFEIVGFKEINSDVLLEMDGVLKYKGLIMPGGYSLPRLNQLYPNGQRNIENFVHSGGSYISFCAGSYYATQHVDWAEESSDPTGNSNQDRDYVSYLNYEAPNLFPGYAVGPVGWSPWKVKGERTLATGLAEVKINTDLEVMKQIGMPQTILLYYFGGPFFDIPSGQEPANYKVWARAIKPKSLRKSLKEEFRGDGMPTIVEFELGKGKVILFSYHPVILLNGKIGGVQVHDVVEKPVANEDAAPFSVDEVNYNSWNILHAALQKGSGQRITPMEHPKDPSKFALLIDWQGTVHSSH